MAISVVVKPFTAFGEAYERGDLVDTGSFRNEAAMTSTRMIRPATPEEYAEAMGLTSSFDAEAAPLARGRKAAAAQESVEDEEESDAVDVTEDDDADVDETETEDDEEEEDDAPPPPPVKPAKAKKTKAPAKAKKTAKK
jgi:hypothetical protein